MVQHTRKNECNVCTIWINYFCFFLGIFFSLQYSSHVGFPSLLYIFLFMEWWDSLLAYCRGERETNFESLSTLMRFPGLPSQLPLPPPYLQPRSHKVTKLHIYTFVFVHNKPMFYYFYSVFRIPNLSPFHEYTTQPPHLILFRMCSAPQLGLFPFIP